MDDQRLERALRQGPPFATRYVSRPLPLYEPRAGRRGAGTGRVVLLVAVTALLLAGMLGGLAAIGGLRDHNPAPRPQDASVIPGLDGQAFMDAWEMTGSRSVCSELQPATGTLFQWTCEDVGDGNLYDEGITLLGESPSAIHSVEAWVALADGGGPVDPVHAGGLFAFVVETAEFTGADTAAARAWASENGGTEGGQLEIAGVTYTLSGTAERRVLTIAPSVSASLESATASGAPLESIDTSEWVPFTSDRYGYTVAHPPSWTATPATRAWDFEIGQRWAASQSEGADQFGGSSAYVLSSAGYLISFTAFAVDVPAGTSEERWMADYYASGPWMWTGCYEYADAEQRPISVDGQRGTMIVGDRGCGASAFVFVDGRVHVFGLEAHDQPSTNPEWQPLRTALLEAFLGTVEFQP
jgi:hypothetical protein